MVTLCIIIILNQYVITIAIKGRNVYCNNMRKKKQKTVRKSSPAALKDFYGDFIKRYDKNLEHELLRQLWDNWDMVCPAEIYGIAKPYAYKGRILFIGAENPTDVQEIRMYYADLLERIQVFLRAYGLETYFEKLEFSLLNGKKSLLDRAKMPDHFVQWFPQRPKAYGKKIDFHGCKSLERCYEAYCNCLKKEENLKKDD